MGKIALLLVIGVLAWPRVWPEVLPAAQQILGASSQLSRPLSEAVQTIAPPVHQTQWTAPSIPYQPGPNTDVLSDGVVGIRHTVDSLFGITTAEKKGTAFYVSPTVVITAEHVTQGTLVGRWTMAGGQVPLTIAAQAPGLDVALLTPHKAMLNATVAARTPLPTVYHPLAHRRPDIGETLTVLCRYDGRGPISTAQVTVVANNLRFDEHMPDGPRTVPGMSLAVTYGDVHEGCSGGPVVDGAGVAYGVLLTSNDAGTLVGVASSVDIINWLRAMQVPGY